VRTAHNGSSVNHGDALISSIVSLWPAAEVLQPYALFHYLKAKAIMPGGVTTFCLLIERGMEICPQRQRVEDRTCSYLAR